jgi:hypothetical protein
MMEDEASIQSKKLNQNEKKISLSAFEIELIYCRV